jgi:tetratricopeptide (TPR) repeat protein
MIRRDQGSAKRAWANFASQSEVDRVSALLNLHTELNELGSEDAVDVGLACIDALLDDSRINEASSVIRSISITRLERGKPEEALKLFDKLKSDWFWLDDLEAGLSHYVKGDALAMLNRKPEASEAYALSVERLNEYPKNQAYSLVELGDAQSSLGQVHEALKSLSRAAEIFGEVNEPGALGFVRTKQGALLIRLENFVMARKMLNEGIALLRLADWRAQLDWSRLNLALLHLYSGHYFEAEQIAEQLWERRSSGSDLSTVASARAILIAVESWSQGAIQGDELSEVATLLGATGIGHLAQNFENPGPEGLQISCYLDLLRDCITLS